MYHQTKQIGSYLGRSHVFAKLFEKIKMYEKYLSNILAMDDVAPTRAKASAGGLMTSLMSHG